MSNMAITVTLPKSNPWEIEYHWYDTASAVVGEKQLLPFMNRFPDIQWHGTQMCLSMVFAYKAVCYMANGGELLGFTYRYEGTGLRKKQFYRYFKMKYNPHRNEIRIYEIPHKQHDRLFAKFRESFPK